MKRSKNAENLFRNVIKSLALVTAMSTSLPTIATAACDTVSMSFAENWDGISFLDKSGEPAGYAIEIHQEIFNRLRIRLELAPNIPWKRQLHRLSTGTMDAIAAINYNTDRDQQFALTEELRSTPVRIFAEKSRPVEFDQITDLARYQGGVSRGASYGREFDTFATNSRSVNTINGTLNIVQLLQTRRIDYFILPQDLGDSLIKKAGATGKVEATGRPIHHISIRSAFSRKSGCSSLVPKFNSILHELKNEGYLETLNAKHFSG